LDFGFVSDLDIRISDFRVYDADDFCLVLYRGGHIGFGLFGFDHFSL
jgi:hypothetical protein